MYRASFLNVLSTSLMTGVLLADSAPVIDLGSRREVFIDDYLIESLSDGAKQKLHQPEAKEVVLITDAPWEGNTSAYYTVFRDGDLFRMYYRGSHWDTERKKATHREVTCYAESKDGINWTKPNLGLFEFDGSKDNNIVLDGLGTHCFVAFKDTRPDCPPEGRYKGISRGRPVGKKGLYVYQSADGIRWSLVKNEPVITEGAFDSQNLAFWDPQRGQYRGYHRTFVKGVRAIMTTTSSDYLNWSKPVLLSYGDGTPAQHLYTNAVLPYERAPHLFLGFPTRYLPGQGQRVEPTLMLSRDGQKFHRRLEPLIPESAPKDRGGNRSNYMAWGLVELPGRPNHLSVFASEAYYTGPDSRLRRFEFRKDGFVSIHAPSADGELRSKLIRFSGKQLELNLVTKKSGSVRVELQDAEGKAIPGLSLSDCVPLRGDQVDAVVTWKNAPDLSKLAGQPVRLRIALARADLYSLRFGK